MRQCILIETAEYIEIRQTEILRGSTTCGDQDANRGLLFRDHALHLLSKRMRMAIQMRYAVSL